MRFFDSLFRKKYHRSEEKNTLLKNYNALVPSFSLEGKLYLQYKGKKEEFLEIVLSCRMNDINFKLFMDTAIMDIDALERLKSHGVTDINFQDFTIQRTGTLNINQQLQKLRHR